MSKFETNEDTEMWAEIRKHSQQKRELNRINSTQIVMEWGQKNNAIVIVFNEAHLRVNERFDFWPGTGKFLDRVTGRYYRGVFNLIKSLEKYEQSIRPTKSS